jgi:IS30 family transposase
MKKYNHLSPEERAIIMIEYNQGKSIRFISAMIHRSVSSVSREIKRNTDGLTKYCATSAARRYEDKRKLCVKPNKLIQNTVLYNQIKQWLIYKQWSPEQISGALKRYYPNQKDMQLSHESIYACIYAHPKGELKKLMVHSLRQSKSKRGPRGSRNSNYRSIQPTPEQLIHHRPEEINARQIPGHWEGDLILGSACKSCVGTLVERTTGYLILSKMQSKSALNVRQGFEAKMQDIPAFLRLSMTYDRGSEMAQHGVMSDNLR